MSYTKVIQTRTGMLDGQCTEATIASIMKVELHEIPDLFTGDIDNPRNAERWITLHDYLRNRNKIIAYYEVDYTPFPIVYPDVHFIDSSKPHGISGHTVDGCDHYCVGISGEIVWDPHPKGNGLIDWSTCMFIVDIDSVPRYMRKWPAIRILNG